MNAKALVPWLFCGLFTTIAMAESPGPTNPNGPSLEAPEPPRTGTESTQENMSPQIERGTLIDERSLKQPNASDRTAPDTETDLPAPPDRHNEPPR
jgi:hypothetical protein